MISLFVDNLTNLDFSFLDPQRGLVGETLIVDAELTGELDEQGMVFDFGHIKRQLRSAIEALVDHKLVVPKHPQLKLRSDNDDQEGGMVSIHWPLPDEGFIDAKLPALAVELLPIDSCSPAALADYIQAKVTGILPENVQQLKLTLRTEEIKGAYYHYSHGLKKHQGACQRIAHGHRSQIHIYRNDEREPTLEQQWATRWKDIYLASHEDLTRNYEHQGKPHYQFEYQSQEGYFTLSLPTQCCELLNTDTTVEHIAQFIVQQLKATHPQDSFTVRAFEGLAKGAIAHS